MYERSENEKMLIEEYLNGGDIFTEEDYLLFTPKRSRKAEKIARQKRAKKFFKANSSVNFGKSGDMETEKFANMSPLKLCAFIKRARRSWRFDCDMDFEHYINRMHNYVPQRYMRDILEEDFSETFRPLKMSLKNRKAY